MKEEKVNAERVDKRKNHIIHEVSAKIKYGKDHIDKSKPKKRIDYKKYLFGESFEKFKARLQSKSLEENYVYRLYKVCEELDMTTEDIRKKYSEKKCTQLEDRFEKLINDFKEKYITKEYDPRAGELHLRYYAFLKFCAANRITLNKDYLRGTLPKKPDNGKDTGYSKEQIIHMLKFTDPRSRLIILLFATSGMREAALCNLRTRDISPIINNDGEVEGAEITIYKHDNEEDKIFCTSECFHAYEAYKKMREELGESISDESPVILRRIPQDREKDWTETKCISDSTLSSILINVMIKAGTRKLLEFYTNINRYDRKTTVAFRKYFETTIIDAKDPITKMNKIDPYRADRLLSHMRRGGLRLTKHYDKSEMWDYYKRVIPELTFSKEQEFKARYEHAEEKIEGLKEAQNYIKEKDNEILWLKEQIIKMNNVVAEIRESGVKGVTEIDGKKHIVTDPEKVFRVYYPKPTEPKKSRDELEKEVQKVVKKARIRV